MSYLVIDDDAVHGGQFLALILNELNGKYESI